MRNTRGGYEVVPFPKLQHQMIDWLGLMHRQHTVRALLELDVTGARQAIRAHRARTGEGLSFTAFVIACFARAIDEDKRMHAYRKGRGRDRHVGKPGRSINQYFVGVQWSSTTSRKQGDDMATTRQQIDDFWALKRLAVIGVSRDPKHFSNRLWQELRQRGYDAVAVNPNVEELDGRRCYAHVQDIEPRSMAW